MGVKYFSKFSFSPYFILIIGVKDEVAQVSITSFSGINSVHPHVHFSFGLSVNGFTGKSSIFARISLPHFLQYQTGNGTPKYLCLDIHQSHDKFCTQLSYLLFICAGYHLIWFPYSKKSFLWSTILINHCGITVYSTSLPHLSCIPTSCSNSSIFITYPLACKSSIICFLASLIFIPP